MIEEFPPVRRGAYTPQDVYERVWIVSQRWFGFHPRCIPVLPLYQGVVVMKSVWAALMQRLEQGKWSLSRGGRQHHEHGCAGER